MIVRDAGTALVRLVDGVGKTGEREENGIYTAIEALNHRSCCTCYHSCQLFFIFSSVLCRTGSDCFAFLDPLFPSFAPIFVIPRVRVQSVTMHHPLSFRSLANLTITILLASNLVSAFHVRDLLHTLRSLKDVPGGSIALNVRRSNFTAPATISNNDFHLNNDTAGSSHPEATTEKEGGLGIDGLLHKIFGRDNKSNTSTTLKARNGTIAAPAAVGSNGTTPSGSPHPTSPQGGQGLGLSGLFHKIFNRHNAPITVPTFNIRASNGTVTPAEVSNGNGTTPNGFSHLDATTGENHGSLGLGGLFHKIFNRHSTPNVASPFNARGLNGTVLPVGVPSNGTVPTGSSHPGAATGKGQGLGLGGLLNKIFGRTNSVAAPVDVLKFEDVDEVDGDVGMLMSLNRRAGRDGRNKLSREERRKHREMRRVRRAMSAAAKAEKEARHVARSKVFRG